MFLCHKMRKSVFNLLNAHFKANYCYKYKLFLGCPFKHSDESNLRKKLQSLHISNGGINNVSISVF